MVVRRYLDWRMGLVSAHKGTTKANLDQNRLSYSGEAVLHMKDIFSCSYGLELVKSVWLLSVHTLSSGS